jgi:hypothetical protein
MSGQTNSDATEQADRVNFYPLSAMVKVLSACPPSTVPLADGNFIEFDGSQIQLLRRGRAQPEMSQNVRGQTFVVRRDWNFGSIDGEVAVRGL